MIAALISRLKRLETVRAAEERDRPLKVEFAYLKQLPREYSGPRHIVSVSKRPDGRYNYEVMTIFFVRAQETGNENR